MGLPKNLDKNILEQILPSPDKFCIEANRRVREKIKKRHNSHLFITLDIYSTISKYKTKNPPINLAAFPNNLKILFAFSKYTRYSDGKRMTAEVLIRSYTPAAN